MMRKRDGRDKLMRKMAAWKKAAWKHATWKALAGLVVVGMLAGCAEDFGEEFDNKYYNTSEILPGKNGDSGYTNADLAANYRLRKAERYWREGDKVDRWILERKEGSMYWSTETLKLETLEESGQETFLTLQEDGTGSLSLLGKQEAITWDAKTLSISGENTQVNFVTNEKGYVWFDADVNGRPYRFTFDRDPSTPLEKKVSHPEDNAFLKATGSDFRPIRGLIKDKYEITITGAEFFRNTKDERSVRVYYDLNNTSANWIQANDINVWATQDGERLDGIEYSQSENLLTRSQGAWLRPEAIVHLAAEFVCDWEGGDILFEVLHYGDAMAYPLMTAEEQKAAAVRATIAPNQMPAKGTEETEIIRIAYYPELATLPAEGELEGKKFRLGECEFFEENGEQIIRIWITYENVGTEEDSYNGGGFLALCMQDGASLVKYSGAQSVPEAEFMRKKVAAGASIDMAFEFYVRDDSPIAFFYKDWKYGKPVIAKMYPVK